MHRVPERLESAVIEHLRSVLAAAHENSNLLEAEPGVPQGDRVALPLRQTSHVLEEGAVLQPLLGHAGGVILSDRLVLDGAAQALAPSMGAEVVSRRIPRDPEEPRHGTGVARFEAVVSLVSVHENLRGDVLSVGRGGHLGADVGIYTTEVVAIQVFEGRPISRHGRSMVWASTVFWANAREGRS